MWDNRKREEGKGQDRWGQEAPFRTPRIPRANSSSMGTIKIRKDFLEIISTGTKTFTMAMQYMHPHWTFQKFTCFKSYIQKQNLYKLVVGVSNFPSLLIDFAIILCDIKYCEINTLWDKILSHTGFIEWF